MHEMGIILHLAKTLEETAVEEHLKKIGSVTLEIGEVSGIMTDLFTDCWNYFSKKSELLSGSELRIVTLPAVTFCETCKQEYETVKFGKICPFCGSKETYLVRGNECIIKEIEAEDDPDYAAAADEEGNESEETVENPAGTK